MQGALLITLMAIILVGAFSPAVAITATQTANASRLRGRDACRMSMAGSRSAR